MRRQKYQPNEVVILLINEEKSYTKKRKKYKKYNNFKRKYRKPKRKYYKRKYKNQKGKLDKSKCKYWNCGEMRHSSSDCTKKIVRLLEEDFENIRNDLEEISDISDYEGKEVYMVRELKNESE